jgi:hypothetical protein
MQGLHTFRFTESQESLPTWSLGLGNNWETVGRAIGDLPGTEGTDIRLGLVPVPLDLHFGRSSTKESLQRYKCIPEGGNRFDLQKNRPDITPDCWVRKKSGGTDLFERYGGTDQPLRLELNSLSLRRGAIYTLASIGLLLIERPLVYNHFLTTSFL